MEDKDGHDFIIGCTGIACHESKTAKSTGGTNCQDNFASSSTGDSQDSNHASGISISTKAPTCKWSLAFYQSVFGHVGGGKLIIIITQ
jgi:hypothetical protein